MLLVPGVFPHFCFIGTGKYLSAQGILAPSVCIALVANVLNGGLNWLLIYRMDGGFNGAPLATSLARWAQLLMLFVYLWCSRQRHAKTIPSWRDPEGVGFTTRACSFMRLGGPVGATHKSNNVPAFLACFADFLRGSSGGADDGPRSLEL